MVHLPDQNGCPEDPPTITLWERDIDIDRDELEAPTPEERARLELSTTEGDGGRWGRPSTYNQ